jgi:hypothetical protein
LHRGLRQRERRGPSISGSEAPTDKRAAMFPVPRVLQRYHFEPAVAHKCHVSVTLRKNCRNGAGHHVTAPCSLLRESRLARRVRGSRARGAVRACGVRGPRLRFALAGCAVHACGSHARSARFALAVRTRGVRGSRLRFARAECAVRACGSRSPCAASPCAAILDVSPIDGGVRGSRLRLALAVRRLAVRRHP